MKRFFGTLFAVVIMTFSLSSATWGEVNVNINVGVPGPRIVLSSPPDFIMPPSLGFYMAVGIPYDLYRVNGKYYIFHDNAWYQGIYYNGPWHLVNHKQLPQSLRHYNNEQIRTIRDEEYRHYRDNRDSYRGKHFKPVKSWKEERKADKKQAKDEKKQLKEQRKADKKQAKDEKKQLKEERRDDRGH